MVVNPVQLQKFLRGMDYPAGKDELIRHAEQHGADQKVIDTLRRIPGRTYDGPSAVSAAVGDVT